MFSNPHITPSVEAKGLDNSIQSAEVVQSNELIFQDGNNLGGMLGVLSLNNQGDNFEEEAFRRRMLRKKKKRMRGL